MSAIVHAPPEPDKLLSAIVARLGSASVLAAADSNLRELVQQATQHHTSIDLIGHTRNGAIRVGPWELQESPSRRDRELFLSIGEVMAKAGIDKIRFLGCGTVLREEAIVGLAALEALLRKCRVTAEIWGTVLPIDETSFDGERRRFRNELRCGVLMRPRLLEHLGEIATGQLGVPSSYVVNMALRARDWSRRPRWPIVVCTSLVDLGRILGSVRSRASATLDGQEPEVELIFIDRDAPAYGVRLFLGSTDEGVFVRVNDPAGTPLCVSVTDLKLRGDGFVI